MLTIDDLACGEGFRTVGKSIYRSKFYIKLGIGNAFVDSTGEMPNAIDFKGFDLWKIPNTIKVERVE